MYSNQKRKFHAPPAEYNTQGRWPSPDPSGIAAVDPFGLSPSNIHASAAFRVASSNDNYGILNSQGQDEFDQMNANFAMQQVSYSLANNNIPDPCQSTGILCNHPDPNGSGATIGDFNGEALCTLNGSDPTCHYLYWNSSAQLWLEPDQAFGMSPLQQYFSSQGLDAEDWRLYNLATYVNYMGSNFMDPEQACTAAAWAGVGAAIVAIPPVGEGLGLGGAAGSWALGGVDGLSAAIGLACAY